MTDEEQRREGLRWKVTKAVRRSKLPSPAKLVMLVLGDIADVGTAEIPERWTPSLSVLADETGLGRSTVAAHLKALEAGGWVVRTRPLTAEALGRGERTRYQLRVPDGVVQEPNHLVQESDYLVREMDQPSAGNGPPLVQEMDAPSAGTGHRNRSSSDLDQISSDQEPPSSAKPPKERKPEPYREDVERICKHLADAVVANGSPAKVTDAWRREARLLIDTPRPFPVTADGILALIDWCQKDDFWSANVRSMKTFRKQYDALRLKARAEYKQARPAAGLREHNGLMLNDRTISDLERRNRFVAMDADSSSLAIEGQSS